MSDHSNIEWTDATWNPVRGCVQVSPGCAHCYAETFAERFRGVKGHPYEQGFDLRLVPEKLAEPLTWQKPRRVFVNSMSDLFQDGVPDAYIDQVFAVMALAPQHTFQVLTKRPERMLAHFTRRHVKIPTEDAASAISGHDVRFREWPLLNVWLGVSVENQHFADERIPLLLRTPAAVRFISAEPLLEPVNCFAFLATRIRDECLRALGRCEAVAGLDWVIVGGESGPGARPFDLAWGRSLVAQCKAAGVPVFVKQLGAWVLTDEFPTSVTANGFPMTDRPAMVGNRLVLHSKKGGDMAEWPTDLRVRDFPSSVRADV